MDRDATNDVGGASRTTADVCATLVELGRTLKGWSFYEPDHAARRELLDRSWRALQGELRRNGPLSLEVRRGAFFLAGSDTPVGTGRVDELARHLYERAVRRIVFEAEVDLETLGAFFDVAVTASGVIAEEGGFDAAFYEGTRRGLQVNDIDWRNLLARAHFADHGTAVRDGGVVAAPASEAALVAESVANEPVADAARFDTEPFLETDPFDTEPDTPLEDSDFGEGFPAARSETTAPIELLDELGPADAEEFPLDADPEVAAAFPLIELLRDLGACDDDHDYRELVRRIVFAAQSLVGEGVADESYRVLRVLATHASDDAKRSFAQRESAGEGLAQIAQGDTLSDVVLRASDASAEVSLHATGVLRELGFRGVSRILDHLEAEIDSERRARLSGVLLAMGETVVPALGEAIASGSQRRRRLALRLAGEAQNPLLVGNLREAMLADDDEVSREAAWALLRVGDVASLEALAEGLESPRAAVVGVAAYSLGACGRVLAVAPLTQALERAISAKQLPLAREIVRALGRLGRPEAGPSITAVLKRGGLFERRKLRDLKLAAITALANLPGRVATEALRRAARSGDGHLRRAAKSALKRREANANPG